MTQEKWAVGVIMFEAFECHPWVAPRIINNWVLSTFFFRIAFLNLFIEVYFSVFSAGSCWINVEDSGRCAGLHEIGITKDECCSSGIVSAGWTPHDQYEQGRLFYFEFLAGGAPECYPCHRKCYAFMLEQLSGSVVEFLPLLWEFGGSNPCYNQAVM